MRGVTTPPGAGALRIWRTRIDPSRAAEYGRFAQERSLPMFRRQPGFRGVAFAGDGAIRVVLTFWADARDALALAGSEDYRATVASIEAAGFLRPPQDVELLEVQATWPDAAVPGR